MFSCFKMIFKTINDEGVAGFENFQSLECHILLRAFPRSFYTEFGPEIY